VRDDSFTGEELARIRTLECEKCDSPAWIDQAPLTPDLAGSAQFKTGAGLLGVSLTLAGTSIKAIYIAGYVFVDEEALASVERALRCCSTEPEAVTRTLRDLQAEGIRLAGIPIEALAEAIRRACESASDRRGQTGRGCFVAPEVEV